MDWITIAGIIAKEGLDVAEGIYKKWQSGQLPTAQDFADLRAMGQTTPQDLVLKAAILVGLTADHPKIQELLALVTNPPAPVPLVAPLPPTGT